VLVVVAECPGLNNQQVSERAGISDQGQISRLMIRLREQGLLQNTRARLPGHAKAWQLTPEGEDVLRANPPLRHQHRPPIRAATDIAARERVASGVSTKLDVAGEQRGGSGVALRLTARTRLVLGAVSELGTRDMAPSNREISQAAGITDQGQISKLLARLEDHGLLQNTARPRHGIPNAWRLTPHGEATLHVASPHGGDKTPARASR
jgi:DNA-binding PadR family transcriptional regulator